MFGVHVALRSSLYAAFVTEVLVAGSPRGLVVFEWCAPRAEWFVKNRARFVKVIAVLLTVRFVEQSSRVLCTFGIVFVSMRRFAGMARFAAWQAASAISSSAHFCIRGRGGLRGRRLSHQRALIGPFKTTEKKLHCTLHPAHVAGGTRTYRYAAIYRR